MTIKRRKSAGQSTAEFALMMPVVMLFFFWIFQVNIYYSALNQTAWAAYAGARTHLVLGGPSPGGNTAKKTVDRILTGKLYEGDLAAPDTLSGESNIYGGGGAEGIIIKLKALDTLPYVSNPGSPLLGFDNEVSTHIGWQEYDEQKYPDDREAEKAKGERQQSKWVTDNNLTDYD